MDKATSSDGEAHALVDAPLAPSGRAVAATPLPEPTRSRQAPTAWCAAALVEPARGAGAKGLVYAASNERRADEIGRALRRFAPDVEVLVLPPWDCLPYDRASPSRECMGRRMAVLARLGEIAQSPRVLVASVEALSQRTPPRRVFKQVSLLLRVGEVLDRDGLQAFAERVGYVFDERVDEAGEIAIRGSVIEIYPAAATGPVRLVLDSEDRIEEIRRFAAVSQRTEDLVDEVEVGPASELILDADGADRDPGAEHLAPEIYGKMPSVFDLVGSARFAADERAFERAADFADQVAEAYEARRSLGEEGAISPPEKLYVGLTAFRAACGGLTSTELDRGMVSMVRNFAVERNPGRAFADYVGEQIAAGRRVVLTGLAHEIRLLSRAVKRGLDIVPEKSDGWGDVIGAPPAKLLVFEADLEAGFEDAGAKLTVIAAPNVLGGRIAGRVGGGEGGAAIDADPDLQLNDVVIHEDYGVGILRALERVEVDGVEEDALRLEYHGGGAVLAPVREFGKIWRYGSEPGAVSLDRLHTDAWSRRRIELSAEIDQTAARLVEHARARTARKGHVLEPPKAAYARFAARFPYPETPDQSAAIEAVLDDMASGKVMSRLVCGDVGFGKTEVALRAAAAATLSGKQVAIVAPTTVLARQHYETFRRRFAGTGVEVASLSRMTSGRDAKRVKDGLADGAVRLVVATHAIASSDVTFSDLGLLIIDEEQRFGARLKNQLREIDPGAHLLTLTATPIPRTLQLAMVGVEDASIIATPPARRRPIRTFLAPWDSATVRTALLRERRRGGQSFVVVPRIEDIDPTAAALERLAPELTARVVHGDLSPEDADEAMVSFAAGQGDVLLATSIIESGLDVPAANTMIVCRADLFGLSQLHQLRGRVGRGRVQGVAYLLHDPGLDLPEATRARLSTLEAFDRLGAGLAISARDLDLRGAGDLIGEEQAGHVKLIGAALYQRLLARAVQSAKGEDVQPEWTPDLNIGITGSIPTSYVPEPTVRINLYVRLARFVALEDIDAFAEELEDRFGDVPEDVGRLLDITRIQLLARLVGVARIDAGPKAIAFTPIGHAPAPPRGMVVKGGRLILKTPTSSDEPRTLEILKLLEALAGRPSSTQHEEVQCAHA